jgi:hypothetical protein
MNEPKRRGRPPKVTEPVINGDTEHKPFDVREAQSYANRVWKGQSISVPRKERLARVEAALKGQGMSMEGVEL